MLDIEIQGRHAETIVQENGRWEVTLEPLHASAEETLIIKSPTESLVFSDIAVGEVWVAAGQSNMEFQMRFEKHRDEEIETCNYDYLRFYDIPEICYNGQTEDFDYSSTAVWRKATKENLDYFSAVGYYFQKELSEALEVPVGIVGCNWGGTVSCAWMKADSVAKAGKPWMDDYKGLVSSQDMNVYWKRQRESIINNRGDLIHDPFTQLILPRTPGMEEIGAFFASSGFSGMPEGMLPSSIPGILFEHMVMAAAPYTVRGILWYQGESDDRQGRQSLYKNMLKALIYDWREAWHDERLPFLIVQLPGFLTHMGIDNLDFTAIRKCQEEVTREVPFAWLCSISDAGEEYDIHPKNKKVVGHRLSLLARGTVYKENILCSAPEAISTERKGKEVFLTFSNAAGGLSVEGSEIQGLQVNQDGWEQKFSFRLEGEQLILLMDGASESQIEITFAQGKWYQVNLYNQAHIPAVPFRICCGPVGEKCRQMEQ